MQIVQTPNGGSEISKWAHANLLTKHPLPSQWNSSSFLTEAFGTGHTRSFRCVLCEQDDFLEALGKWPDQLYVLTKCNFGLGLSPEERYWFTRHSLPINTNQIYALPGALKKKKLAAGCQSSETLKWTDKIAHFSL